MRGSSLIFKYPTLHILQQCKFLDDLKQFHAHMITSGLILHTYPLSRLLISSSTLASVSYTLTIFNQVKNPTIFLFNTLISSLANKDDSHMALSVYSRILTQASLEPNSYTYPSLFKVCGARLWLHHGRALHTHVLKFLKPPYDQFVQASLLNFYAKFGRVDISRHFFDQISRPDLAAWNSVLSAYASNSGVSLGSISQGDHGNLDLSLEVLHLFREMQNSFCKPNEVTLVALVSACADMGALDQGMWGHAYVIKNNLEVNPFLGSALITMYGNIGCLDFALQLFDQLPQRDTVCYNAMIRGLAIHGHGHVALKLFQDMKQEGFIPDDVTILVVMFACSHLGLVNQGCELLESMESEYGLQPKLEHYSCLVDLLGRAGQVKEAERRIQDMPSKSNAILWRSLLGAATVHGDLEVGEVALKHLIQLEPETSGNYVLLSNLYASINRWEDANNVRLMMKGNGIDKMPGGSMLETNSAIQGIEIGDNSHPETK